jgi:hypothetical protein
MWVYALLIFGLIWALLAYRQVALKRFDRDPEQHYLAAQLVALATGRRHATETDLSAHLDKIASSAANRRARVIHAVLIVRKSAPPAIYAKVLEISRRLR